MIITMLLVIVCTLIMYKPPNNSIEEITDNILMSRQLCDTIYKLVEQRNKSTTMNERTRIENKIAAVVAELKSIRYID